MPKCKKKKNVQKHTRHTDNNPMQPFNECKFLIMWHTRQFQSSPNSCCTCTICNAYKLQVCLIFASNFFNNMVKVLALAATSSSLTKQGSQWINGTQISITGTSEVKWTHIVHIVPYINSSSQLMFGLVLLKTHKPHILPTHSMAFFTNFFRAHCSSGYSTKQAVHTWWCPSPFQLHCQKLP